VPPELAFVVVLTSCWSLPLTIQIQLSLPDWLSPYMEQGPRYFSTPAARMSLAIELAAHNVLSNTGGPFGAAVFEKTSGLLVGVGVNLVMASGMSMAHAEMVAIAVAQKHLDDISLDGLELATSAEPCSMCLGGIHWAGVKSVLIGARDEDVRAIGFHEGHKPMDWELRWRTDGIHVQRDLLRAESCAVLRAYAQRGGIIYNADKLIRY
jgi:tRNA(Arg) A34 adenosine deaminase TadA